MGGFFERGFHSCTFFLDVEVGDFEVLAQELEREAEEGLVLDVETFVQMSRIRESLRNGRVTEALAWCTENKKDLRRMEVSFTSETEKQILTLFAEQSRVHAAVPTIYRAGTDTRSN